MNLAQVGDSQSSGVGTWDLVILMEQAKKHFFLVICTEPHIFSHLLLLTPNAKDTSELLNWNFFLCQREGSLQSWLAWGNMSRSSVGTVDLFLLALQRIDSFAFIWMSGTSSFHQMGSCPVSENNLSIFQDNLSCHPFARSGCDWRAGMHFPHANKALKQTTGSCGDWQYLGCLACKSSLV